ncbi:MAG TPA: hypothetical protein VIF14_03200, partial [Alphaproteobacteria bacterium]
GCTDTLFFAERSSFKLGIHVNDNPVTPLQVNAGAKRTVIALAPPLAVRKEGNRDRPVGEAVNLFSGFDLQYDKPETWASPFTGTLTIKTQFASGAAAVALADKPAVVKQLIEAEIVQDFDCDKTCNAITAWVDKDRATSSERVAKLMAWARSKDSSLGASDYFKLRGTKRYKSLREAACKETSLAIPCG